MLDKLNIQLFIKSNRDEVIFSTSMNHKNPLKPSPKIDVIHSQFLKEPFKLRRHELSPIPRRFPVIPNSFGKSDSRFKGKEIIKKTDKMIETNAEPASSLPKVM